MLKQLTFHASASLAKVANAVCFWKRKSQVYFQALGQM